MDVTSCNALTKCLDVYDIIKAIVLRALSEMGYLIAGMLKPFLLLPASFLCFVKFRPRVMGMADQAAEPTKICKSSYISLCHGIELCPDGFFRVAGYRTGGWTPVTLYPRHATTPAHDKFRQLWRLNSLTQ